MSGGDAPCHMWHPTAGSWSARARTENHRHPGRWLTLSRNSQVTCGEHGQEVGLLLSQGKEKGSGGWRLLLLPVVTAEPWPWPQKDEALRGDWLTNGDNQECVSAEHPHWPGTSQTQKSSKGDTITEGPQTRQQTRVKCSQAQQSSQGTGKRDPITS